MRMSSLDGPISIALLSMVEQSRQAALKDGSPLAACFIEPDRMKAICSENALPYRRGQVELKLNGIPVRELELVAPDSFYTRTGRQSRF